MRLSTPKLKRASSDFSYFQSSQSAPLLSFRTLNDYKWIDEIWQNMKSAERIKALTGYTDDKGRGLLIKAVRHCEYALIHTLLCNMAMDVNQQDIYGNSALHHAAIMKDTESMSILLASPRITANIVNRDGRTACELLLTDYASFNDEIREHCFARTLIDQTIVKYALRQIRNVTAATKDPELLNTLQQAVRHLYEAAWFVGEYRDRPFPLYLISLATQNEIIAHHFTLYTQ